MKHTRVGAVFTSGFILISLLKVTSDLMIPEKHNESVSVSEPVGGVATGRQLDQWINDARKVMKREGIPGSYDGIHRNIIRESGGNPRICNDSDVNAKNGIPSCGLLQVIPPTFEANKLPQSAYDSAGVKADADDRMDPVSNIVTACNYAAHRYGSIDRVSGPY